MEENTQNDEEQKTENTVNVQEANNTDASKKETVGADGFTEKEKDDGKLMALLSYLSVLVLIPYFTEKDNKWVRFHSIQGMNLFIVEVIGAFLGFIPLVGGLISGLVSLILAVLSIIGIINVFKGQAEDIPIIGKLKIVNK